MKIKFLSDYTGRETLGKTWLKDEEGEFVFYIAAELIKLGVAELVEEPLEEYQVDMPAPRKTKKVKYEDA
jgi:hypothetical protein